MTITILELMDVLNEVMMENDMEDLPVFIPATGGGVTALREDMVTTEQMMDGEAFTGVVIG